MARAIDLHHLGRDRVISCWEIDGVLVDPGPATCLETLEAALEGPPRAVVLTHIHLDHAGATGHLVRRHPELPVYVHERGAPHLVDPERLLASVARLWGDEAEELFGPLLPVPKANVHPLRGGEEVVGLRVAATPGHASHHVALLHEPTGSAFTGDIAGVRIPPSAFAAPPTPPPELDLPAWERSLETLEDWDPASFHLAHFGAFEDVDAHLRHVREYLAVWGERARAHGQEAFVAAVEAELAEEGEEVAERFALAAPLEHLWLGLDRYWRKWAERQAQGGPS